MFWAASVHEDEEAHLEEEAQRDAVQLKLDAAKAKSRVFMKYCLISRVLRDIVGLLFFLVILL